MYCNSSDSVIGELFKKQPLTLNCGGKVSRSAKDNFRTWDFVKTDQSRVSLTEAEFNKACVVIEQIATGCCGSERHPNILFCYAIPSYGVSLGPIVTEGNKKWQKYIFVSNKISWLRVYEKVPLLQNRLDTLMSDTCLQDHCNGKLLWEMTLINTFDFCKILNFRRTVLLLEDSVRRLAVMSKGGQKFDSQKVVKPHQCARFVSRLPREDRIRRRICSIIKRKQIFQKRV